MRKKEISRRPFTDSVWEITYEGGGLGYEGASSKEQEPIVPMDIPSPKVTTIVQDQLVAANDKADHADVAGKSRKLRIGVDISKQDAIDLILTNEDIDRDYKKRLIAGIQDNTINGLDESDF